jgi:hypothetical protein
LCISATTTHGTRRKQTPSKKKGTNEGTIEILWEADALHRHTRTNLGLFCALSAPPILLDVNMSTALGHRENVPRADVLVEATRREEDHVHMDHAARVPFFEEAG